MAHSGDTLDFKLISQLNGLADNESVGFRDIIIIFSTETTPLATSYCGITSTGYALPDNPCTCGSGTTMTFTDSGVCGTCDSSCATCNGPTSSDCVSCAAGYYLSSGSCLECTSPCGSCSGDADWCISCEIGYCLAGSTCYLAQSPWTSTVVSDTVSYCQTSCGSQFALWDGSCSSSCDSPLVPETAGTFLLCTFPCEDESMHYYDWNSSCISGCPPPLTESTYLGRYFCSYSCGDSSEYLYWNGSCLGSCPSPLSGEIQGTTTNQRNFCWYPCQVGEYLYWNGSCLSTCPSPLASEIQGTTADQRKFCWYTCQPSEYLYWNGSCLSSCPSPLSPEVQGTTDQRNFCWYTCQPGEYLYWNGSCLSTCPSPLASETQGTIDQRKFCWYTCQLSEYLYWNGSCLGSCPSPLSPEVQGTTPDQRKFCWYTCQPNQYLFWNQSCGNTCPSPLSPETQGTVEQRDFCWYTCQSGEYLYWNGSCLGNCPSPLSPEVQGTTPDQKNFCWYTCQPNEYLYWNRSCVSGCPSPLNPEIQGVAVLRNFCRFPCSPDEYLYWNGSCIPTCPLPLMIVNNPDISYCFLPCASPDIYWYKNNTCHSKCGYPYNIIPWSGVLQCLSPCSKDLQYFYDQDKKCYSKCDYPYEKQMIDVVRVCHFEIAVSLQETENILSSAATIKTQGEYTSGSMKAASVISSSSPASALLAGLSAMLQYIRYMKINYPPRVQVLFLVSAGDPISLGFDFEIPLSIEGKLIDHPLPEVFEKYDINSNFVNNLWDMLMNLVLNLFAIGVFTLLDIASRKYGKINKVIAKILQIMKWNMPLAMICGSSGDIFFYSSLQFISSPLDSAASIACFVICLIMIISVVALFIITLKIVRSRQRETPEGEDWKEKWSSCEILFVEYEERTVLSLGYMAIFILRGTIFNLTIANLYNFPLVQSIIINVANLSMFGYILYLRPLKELIGVAQLFLTEGIVNIVSVCVLILAIMDKAHIDGQSTRVNVGDTMVFLIKAFNTFALVFMGISTLLFLISAYKIWKLLHAKGIKSPLKMIMAIISGDLEVETLKAANISNAAMSIIARRPKIKKLPRKVKPINNQDLSGMNNMIHMETAIDESIVNLPPERSVNNSTEHSFLPSNNNMTKLQLNQGADGLEITNLESPGLRFQGLDETVIEEIKNMGEAGGLEKRTSAENVLSRESSGGLSSGGVDMFESLRKLKTRMNRVGNITFKTEHDKKWYDGIRKLKNRLRNGLGQPGINLGN